MGIFSHGVRLDRSVLRRIAGMGWIILLLTGGCTRPTGEDVMYQYFDEASGATITRLTAPVPFHKEEPMLAANARDYVYIGPAEMNRSGNRQLVLWMNFCSTIDRGRYSDSWRPDGVFLILDGTPMELTPADSQLGVSEWSYVSPVVGGSTLVYAVTRAQLRLLARAGDVRILAEVGGQTREYARWRSADTGLQRFAGYIDDEDQFLLTSADE